MLLMTAILIFGLWYIMHVLIRCRPAAIDCKTKNRPEPGGFFLSASR
jgi:hypothetical protein